jgi:protein-S-isoprenylcysteine O-methyltransferase Ste14
MSTTPPPPSNKHVWMRMNPVKRAIGLVVVAVGIGWFLIGIGFVSGSQFSGSWPFAIVGVVLVNVGLVVLHRTWSAAKRDIAADS